MKISEKLQEIRKNMFLSLVSKEKVQQIKQNKVFEGNVIIDVLNYSFFRGPISKIKTQKDTCYLNGNIGNEKLNILNIITLFLLFSSAFFYFMFDFKEPAIFTFLMLVMFIFATSFLVASEKSSVIKNINQFYHENDLSETYEQTIKSSSEEERKMLLGDFIEKDKFEELMKEIMLYVSEDEIIEELKKRQVNKQKYNFESINNPVVLFEVLGQLINKFEKKEKNLDLVCGLKLNHDILKNIK